MLIKNNSRLSKISICLDVANHFLLTREDAIAIIENQINTIGKNWQSVCDMAGLTEVDRQLLWHRQFLNAFCYEDLADDASHLSQLIKKYK